MHHPTGLLIKYLITTNHVVTGVTVYQKAQLPIDCNDYNDNNVMIDLYDAKNLLFEVECGDWNDDVHKFPYLWIYALFIHVSYTAPYISNLYNRVHRTALAQFVTGSWL